MNVTYTPAATQDPDNYRLMQLATRVLERDILRHHAAEVTAVWDRTQDANGQPLYTLRLRDPAAESTRGFTPADLRTDSQVYFRLALLWDDLLRIDLHKRLDRMREDN